MENEKEFVICFDCGEEIPKEEAYEFGGEYFCNEECAENYVICRICDRVHHINDSRFDSCDNDNVCEDCYDEYNLYTCEVCGEITEEVYAVDGGDSFVCEDCTSDYYRCDDCGDYFTRGRVFTDDFNHVICCSCYETNNHYTCDNCGEILEEGDTNFTEDNYYCNDCYDEVDINQAIHDYSYKPDPLFYNSSEEENTINPLLYMGIELEVDNGNNRQYGAEHIIDNLDFLYCKSDGSLTEGFEIVSHPCTLGFHMENDYKSNFKWLIQQGWRSNDTSTCGLHVHVNRTYLGDNGDIQDLTIAKIMLIMDRLWDNGLVKFTRRKERELNQWSKRCAIEEMGISNLDEPTIIRKSKSYKDCGRYYALNLRNSNTIEFRLFKGTLNHTTFIGTLQFVSNIVNFAKDKSLMEIQQTHITMADIVNYVEHEELTEYATKRELI